MLRDNMSSLRVGVYVDVANISLNGGYGMQYDVLREFACRDGAEPIRLNAYVVFDPQRADVEPDYRHRNEAFFSTLRDMGYKVIQKEMRYYTDAETGARIAKANTDLEMAVDALLQSENLDRVVMATGDGDFVQVVRALQNNGCRVELVAFENISSALRKEADTFFSGYLIPKLLPVDDADEALPWGEIGSRVRGVCHFYKPDRGFGFFRFLKLLGPALWITDSRRDDSPYAAAFFHATELPEDVNPNRLPSRRMQFEFAVGEPERPGDANFRAHDIRLVATS